MSRWWADDGPMMSWWWADDGAGFLQINVSKYYKWWLTYGIGNYLCLVLICYYFNTKFLFWQKIFIWGKFSRHFPMIHGKIFPWYIPVHLTLFIYLWIQTKIGDLLVLYSHVSINNECCLWMMLCCNKHQRFYIAESSPDSIYQIIYIRTLYQKASCISTKTYA